MGGYSVQLGENETVRSDEIVGIFDIDATTETEITRKFLKRSNGRFETVNLSNGIPKSFVLCDDGIGSRVYISGKSVGAIMKTIMKGCGVQKNIRADGE